MKEGFIPRKEKVYPLSRKEREEMHKFIQEQLRKGYIRPSKSSQIAPVFFVDVIYKSTCLENYIPVVMLPLNPISPSSTAATFLATRLMAVLQPSGYSVFHDRDTPIQLSLP